ncbi:unnamed protein product [Pleuronectes platessa]|uniref:Uncharacterized protein n=1 Tax=Pleuronectes platessa TaxID=8262 RepID=A0A9N7UXB9_PLEPL|nr:unnamed protein product [Pleuronectes platessa]
MKCPCEPDEPWTIRGDRDSSTKLHTKLNETFTSGSIEPDAEDDTEEQHHTQTRQELLRRHQQRFEKPCGRLPDNTGQHSTGSSTRSEWKPRGEQSGTVPPDVSSEGTQSCSSSDELSQFSREATGEVIDGPVYSPRGEEERRRRDGGETEERRRRDGGETEEKPVTEVRGRQKKQEEEKE